MAEVEWLDEAVRLRESGLTFRSVARELGLSHNTVYHYLRRKRMGPKRECVNCGIEFTAYDTTQKYCSRNCWAENPPKRSPEATERMRRMMSDRKGAKNPNFKHGKSEARDRRMDREFKAKAKDEGRCRACGLVGYVHAHHVLPRSLCPSAKYDDRNCLPLCPSCHSRWHRRSLTIHRSVFTEAEWAYISTREIGQSIDYWLDERYPKEAPADAR